MLDTRNFYINGKWVAPHEARDHHVINPTNEEPCTIVSLGSENDVNDAVAAARAAFNSWKETPVEDRIAALESLIENYEEGADEMAEAMKFAVIAGRKSFVSGRISKTLHGSPSTTNKGII